MPIAEAVGAFIRTSVPLPFDAPDGRPVSMIFILLVPENATDLHLQILSELAQMFSDKAFRDAVSAAPDAASVHELFAKWQPGGPGG